MEKTLKRLRLPVALLVVLAMLLTLSAAPVFAKAPQKEKVKYLGSGKVEVDFIGDVQYKKAKVTVKSGSKSYKATIYNLDEDDLNFKVKNYKAGKTYKFTIKGVRREGTSAYGKVTGSFKISKSAPKVKVEHIDYLGSNKVEVEFDHDVRYKNVKVTVKSGSKSYKASIYKKDEDEIRFTLPKKCRTKGKTYSFTISGVRERGQDAYGKATGKVKVPKASSISKSKAIDIAIKASGVKKSRVYDVEAEKEKDYGKTYWEVTFKAGNYEYEYHITMDGKIRWWDKEYDD